MKCHRCSREYADHFKFCPGCGAPKAPNHVASAVRTHVAPSRARFFSKKRIVVSACALVAIITLVLGLIFGLSSSGAKWSLLPALGLGQANVNVLCLARDSVHSILYAGTDGAGVWEYKNEKWSGVGGQVSGAKVESLAYDSGHDVLYAGTDGSGVWKHWGGRWSNMNFIAGGSAALAYDAKDGVLYADGGAGIWQYRNNNWTYTRGGQGLLALTCDANGILYGGSPEGTAPGVWAYKNGAWSSLNGPLNEDNNNNNPSAIRYYVNALVSDQASGALYVGTDNHGAWRCDNPGAAPSWTNVGLDSTVTQSLYLDSSKNTLYAGEEGSGVFKYVDGKWSNMAGLGNPDHVLLAGDSRTGVLYAAATTVSSEATTRVWQYK